MRSFCKQKGSASIENGCETTTRSYALLVDQRRPWWKNCEGIARNHEEHRRTREPYCGSNIRDGEDLLVLMSSGGAPRFSGQDRSMQRPWLVQTGFTAEAAELVL